MLLEKKKIVASLISKSKHGSIPKILFLIVILSTFLRHLSRDSAMQAPVVCSFNYSSLVSLNEGGERRGE